MTDGARVRWCRRDDVPWRRTLDAAVIAPPGVREPVTLAGTGAAVWDLLGEAITVPDLVARLAQTYAADPTAVEADVVELLDRLAALGAVTHTP